MKNLTAILFATSAIISATSVAADSSGMNDPFFWIGDKSGSPEQAEIAEPKPTLDMQRDKFTETKPTDGATKPSNPVLDDFPTDASPNRGNHGQATVSEDGCEYPHQAPATMDFSNPKKTTGERGVSPHDRRRGEMAGDDGVLSAIQETPCTDIMRRGGETANSARGYLRDGDIRRVNTLEDRKIPTHSVGRYSPEGSGLWYRDPSNPYIDTANEWQVRSGETLSQLLHRWGDDAGFTIVYQADTDFVLQADVIIRGTFPEASGQVIESFANANPPITADFFLGNKVIVVRGANEFDGS